MSGVYPFLNTNSLIVILARRASTAILLLLLVDLLHLHVDLLPLCGIDLPPDPVPGADPVQRPHTPGHSLIVLHLPQHNVTLLAESCLTFLQPKSLYLTLETVPVYPGRPRDVVGDM